MTQISLPSTLIQDKSYCFCPEFSPVLRLEFGFSIVIKMNDFIFFSGYGSQAVSSTNLSSEDSISIRSISVDETPDIESRAVMLVEQLQPVSEISDHFEEKESDTTNKSNWKHSVSETMSTAVKNETHTNSSAQKAATQKPNEMMEKEGNLDITGGPLLVQNTALEGDKQALSSSMLDRNSLSLELTNSHTCNLGSVNDSGHNDGISVLEYSSVPQAVNNNCNEAEQTVTDALQHVSGDQNCGISMTESHASDNQSEASRIATYDSTFMSPFEETQILGEPGPTSMYSKAVSSPEPASTSVINSGDDESPCEGTSVVHTRLPPGKV
jgi:hypothetical protein